MSRGLGSLQRHVLGQLNLGGGGLERRRSCGEVEIRPLVPFMAGRGYRTPYELAHSIRGAEPTRSELSALHRAIRGLKALGLVEVWAGGVRLPVTAEQCEAEHLEFEHNRAADGLRPRANWP